MARRKPRASKLAVSYGRVSTAGQMDEGVSLEAQRARIAAWAQANGYRLRGIHVDAGWSGGKAHNRPALQTAIEEVCRERGALVLEADETEQGTLARLRELRAHGLSVRRIADALKRECVPARAGRWHHDSVWRVLRREPEAAA